MGRRRSQTCSNARGKPWCGLAWYPRPQRARRSSPIPAISISPGDAMTKKRVAVLISGRGSNMASLIEAAQDNRYPAEIALVVSNLPDAAGLAHAREQGIATKVVDHRPNGKNRAAFERELQRVFDDQGIEVICLAGFMRLFTSEFVLRWHGKMLNIHPALLPSFPGLDPHGQALR